MVYIQCVYPTDSVARAHRSIQGTRSFDFDAVYIDPLVASSATQEPCSVVHVTSLCIVNCVYVANRNTRSYFPIRDFWLTAYIKSSYVHDFDAAAATNVGLAMTWRSIKQSTEARDCARCAEVVRR